MRRRRRRMMIHDDDDDDDDDMIIMMLVLMHLCVCSCLQVLGAASEVCRLPLLANRIHKTELKLAEADHDAVRGQRDAMKMMLRGGRGGDDDHDNDHHGHDDDSGDHHGEDGDDGDCNVDEWSMRVRAVSQVIARAGAKAYDFIIVPACEVRGRGSMKISSVHSARYLWSNSSA
jgi:hypothetical protein